MTRIAILGGGPAGLGAAWRLRHTKKADVVLFERENHFGGNAGSFAWNGHFLDYGSHRLHPACDEEILEDIRRFLGEDLLDRPRHGRIRLLGKWVHFPLKPGDLLLHLDKRFALGSLRDAARKMLPQRMSNDESFATVLRAGLGPTICEHFYFPYARKIWGRDPQELSAIQARRRVSASGFGKLIKKVLGQVPGLKPKGSGRFFYPRRGFGAISDVYAEQARRVGADLRLDHTVTRLAQDDDGRGWTVEAEHDGRSTTDHVDYVWSTIPVTVLSRLLDPPVAPEIVEATRRVHYRAMILVYAELDVDQFTEFDAHYFPGDDVRITRMSEPKNYAVRTEPKGRTVLCAELPCDTTDDVWSMSDDDLGDLFAADLERTGLSLPGKPVAVTTRRLPQAYPIYLTGYEDPLHELDSAVGERPRLLTYGRQGLFAHDNTHHALFMAYAAERCLSTSGEFDTDEWAQCRKVFETHVVED